MRRRGVLAGASVTLLVVLGTTAPALASEEEEECILEQANVIEQAEAEGVEADYDTCEEAPNPILPETNEIIWGGLAFLVLFVLLSRFGLPVVRQTMNDRTERIRGDLDSAEKARTDAEGTLGEYEAQLADAKSEAARIMEEARQDADAYRESKRADADAEVAEVRRRGLADVEASKQQALADLQADVTSIALGAAEQVVGHNLDQATNSALVEQYIADVSRASSSP